MTPAKVQDDFAGRLQMIALVLDGNDAVVLRSFEASDGTLFRAAPVVLH
jgi:hypothetical protein